ncbi:SAM-dependent methyltransferases [hydrothermal vent metagenome]|uniref:SAM-dependent methyltransferases n=1 Tax=hydrothermal vent metagenome TaxID=652676 RepID=A0A3B0UJ07_9ZZZZ
MSLHHHKQFNDKSDLYAAARPTYPDELFEFLFSQCPDFEQAWDCGTGSGQAAVSLAKRFHHVEATDVSPQQIANATAHKRVHYSVQPAETTHFANDAFSLITVAQALHWFEFNKFWPEVHRVLKPGGIFAAWGYSWFHISTEIDAIIATKLMPPIKNFWAAQNQLLWDGYQAIPFPFVTIPTPQIILAQQWNLAQLLAYLGSWSAVRHCIEANGDEFFVELTAALGKAWGSAEEKKVISMDFHLMVGRHEA